MNISDLKGVGPKTISLLNKLNIFNVNDLLSYYPYRYEIIRFSPTLKENEDIYIKGVITSVPQISYIKRNFNRLSFNIIFDNMIIKVTIFNRAFIKNLLTINIVITLKGKYDKLKNQFTASNIIFDNIKDEQIEPIYHLIKGLKNKALRKLILYALTSNPELLEYIPYYLVKEYNMIERKQALNYIHNPKSINEIKQAKLRLIYEELFLFMFKINYLKYKNKEEDLGIKRKILKSDLDSFIKSIPFSLTHDQEKAVDDIKTDLENSNRMNRLVIGDVGSGKTIVSVIAIYLNFLNGYQSALMAPTEILANQHFETITKLMEKYNFKIELLTGKLTKKQKDNIYLKVKNKEVDLVIGTHALISDDVCFANLGLVITDEQHRFGVNQRNIFQNKGRKPDVLYMSATPIPRTYALTLYGDMDISFIKEKPKGRQEVTTVLKSEKEIKDVLSHIYEELKLNHQVFVVAPLIDENEENDLNDVNLLKKKFLQAFPEKVKIEILHGKLKKQEKEKIMNNFKKGLINILISTTVIEVGVDIPNATMMVIFNAERFGLATLHQLRGRVGRNDLAAFCYLISSKETKRLEILTESNDGFYVTEKDFELRGEGDLFGIKQSGDMIFKIANLKRDYKILLQAKKDSEIFLYENIKNDFREYEAYKRIIKDISFLD